MNRAQVESKAGFSGGAGVSPAVFPSQHSARSPARRRRHQKQPPILQVEPTTTSQRFFAISHSRSCGGRILSMHAAWDRGLSAFARAGVQLIMCAWIIASGFATVGAQENPATRAPIPRAIILPTAVVAGAQATLAVVDGTGRLIPGVAVGVGLGTTSQALGPRMATVVGVPVLK